MGKRLASLRAVIGVNVKKVTMRFDERDVVAFTGVAFAIYGGELIFRGAGWLIGGVALYWLAVRRR